MDPRPATQPMDPSETPISEASETVDTFHDSLAPSRACGLSARRGMQCRLAISLNHIIQATRDHVASGYAGRISPRISTELAAPEAKIACEVFALHADFLDKAESGRLSELAQSAERLAKIPWQVETPGFVVHRLDPTVLGTERYTQLTGHSQTSGEVGFGLCPPDTARARAAEACIQEARALLANAAPQFADEVEAVLGEIFIAEQRSHDEQTPQFEGLSSFRLWGSAIFHPDSLASPLEAALELVHECTHALLFSASIDGALVHNRNEERYPSPLRSDLRPMDGILHATIVLLRMLCCLRSLGEAQELKDNDRAWVEQRQADYVAAAQRGLAQLRSHARWSPRGAPIWRATEQFAHRFL